MIHINVNRIPLTDIQGFIAAADAAQKKVNEEKGAKRRKALIDSHRLKWVAFRAAFEQLSCGKCWYTESRNPGTDDDVDHFRPKGAIAEDDDHGGYYWKALDWKNFRLSCHRANRLRENPTTGDANGKADHFPLLDPTTRARKPDDPISLEWPLILDPCDPFDPPKLTFYPDGTVAISPKYEHDIFAVKQVETSRVLLHLDWPAFVDDRTKLYNKIAVKVKEGENHAQLYAGGDAGSGKALRSIVAELADLIREGEPYSAAALAYISVFRAVWWVRDIVLKIPTAVEMS